MLLGEADMMVEVTEAFSGRGKDGCDRATTSKGIMVGIGQEEKKVKVTLEVKWYALINEGNDIVLGLLMPIPDKISSYHFNASREEYTGWYGQCTS